MLSVLTCLCVPDDIFYAQESSLFPKGDSSFFGERYSPSLVRLLLISICPFSLRLRPAPLHPGRHFWHKIRCFTYYSRAEELKDLHGTVPNSQESPLRLTGLTWTFSLVTGQYFHPRCTVRDFAAFFWNPGYRSSDGIECQAFHVAAKEAIHLKCTPRWHQTGGLRHTRAFFLLIADENGRLALPSSSHPCSSVLPSFPKEGKPCQTTPTALPYPLAPQLHHPALTRAVKQERWRGLTPNPAALGFWLSHGATSAEFSARRAPVSSQAVTDSFSLIMSNAACYPLCI